MYVIKNDIRKLEKYRVNSKQIHLTVHDDYSITFYNAANDSTRVYQPLPTLKLIHENLPDNVVISVMGAYGSGKSTGINMQVILNAVQHMPPCKDGVRRAKVAMIRNTYEELKQTTFELWGSWFDELGEVRSTQKPLEYHHVFYDKDGKIELDLQFLSLDKKEQFRKLRSSFFTFAYINEVSESPEGIISQVLARTGRYPSMDLIDISKVKRWYERDVMVDDEWQVTKTPYWAGVMCDTNPPDTKSEFYDIFEVQQPRRYKLYKQPPGLIATPKGWSVNQNAENIERLGLDYYIKQTYSNSEEFIKVFCCGEYGVLKSGKLVYQGYNDNIHAVDKVEFVKEAGLRLAFDTWFNPACTVSQYSMQQLRVLAALKEEGCTLEAFVNEVIKPFLHDKFNGVRLESIVLDPAGMAGEKIKGATSDYSILKKAFGDVVRPASTNVIKTRLNAVEHFLSTLIRGNPAIIIDKQGCDPLRQGFLKEYVWRENRGTGETIYEPLKNRYSDIQDALQYEALTIVNMLNINRDAPKPFKVLPPARSNDRRNHYYV